MLIKEMISGFDRKEDATMVFCSYTELFTIGNKKFLNPFITIFISNIVAKKFEFVQ